MPQTEPPPPAVTPRRLGLRCAITLAAMAVVAGSLWQSQGPGQSMDEDAPLVYPPSLTYDRQTQYGWPGFWLVRRVTGELFSRATPAHEYSTIPAVLATNVVVWILILAGTASVAWRVTGGRAQFRLGTILVAQVAIAILLCWWKIEYDETSTSHAVLTRLLRADPTTPLLRLLQCPTMVFLPILLGMFCVLCETIRCSQRLFVFLVLDKRASESTMA